MPRSILNPVEMAMPSDPVVVKVLESMPEYQLGRTLTDEQTTQIVDFLKVLTGKIDPEYIKSPVLPKSTATTPGPDER